MVIYADVMFAEGFIFNFIILYMVSAAIKIRHPVRIAAVSAFGAVYGILMIVFQPPCAVLLDCAASAAAVLAAFGKTGIYGFAKRFFLFEGLQLFVSGVCEAAGLRSNTYIHSLGRLYPVISDAAFFVCTGAAALAACIVYILISRKRRFFRVRIRNGGAVRNVSAYYDSGNMLTWNGRPVCIIDSRLAAELGVQTELEIPCRSISGEYTMRGFIAEEIYFPDENRRIKDAVMAVAEKPLSAHGDFSILLNRNI